MCFNRCFVVTIALTASFAVCATGARSRADGWQPDIPKVWTDAALATLEVPLPDRSVTRVPLSSALYYRIPERPVFKSYPVYAPGHEPPGYLDWLANQDPQIVFDSSRLHSRADWVRAGKAVFDASPVIVPLTSPAGAEIRDAAWYQAVQPPLTKDGVNPFASYVVREKGKSEVGFQACSSCHTRVMRDGTVITGAQGNNPVGRRNAYEVRHRGGPVTEQAFRMSQGVPWLRDDPARRIGHMTREEFAVANEALPAGVIIRQGASVFHPTAMPDLIGVKDRKYLDRTGMVRQRSIADFMRYAAMTQGMDLLTTFNGWVPAANGPEVILDERIMRNGRYSDEQLYALALYVYSLQPPPNPNAFDALAARGRKVFESERCGRCHTAPLYTNNKLIPVDDFTPSREDLANDDIDLRQLGTDPGLTLLTRRGTGYYKVPSLKGVWYRGPFEHSGSVMTLEDWFDPRRLANDYRPTGFTGVGVKTRAVPGHAFGLKLSDEDRRALIAFLKTL